MVSTTSKSLLVVLMPLTSPWRRPCDRLDDDQLHQAVPADRHRLGDRPHQPRRVSAGQGRRQRRQAWCAVLQPLQLHPQDRTHASTWTDYARVHVDLINELAPTVVISWMLGSERQRSTRQAFNPEMFDCFARLQVPMVPVV
jgi:hypothetical protein